MESPAPRNSRIVWTVIRVPRTTGRPLQTDGSMTILSLILSRYQLWIGKQVQPSRVPVPFSHSLPYDCPRFSRFSVPFFRSGKIDITTQSFFAGIFNQPEQMGRFRLMRAAADQDDEAGMVSPGGEFQKVIPVTGHHEHTLIAGVGKNLGILSRDRQNLSQ